MVTVLVVDDDPVSRIFLEAFLQQAGHRAVTAENGQEALLLLEQESCDLVLMDIQMPVLDGYETTRRIKSGLQAGRFIPVIFLTSVQSDRELARCLDCGGDDFLTKPPNPIILDARIKAWLQRAELANQLENSYTELQEAYRYLSSLNIKLIAAEQLKQDVDRIAKHDLKTPLNSIIGFSDLLLGDHALSSEQRKKVGIIYESGINVLHMVNLSLGLYQMERGEYPLKAVAVDLLAIVRTIRENLSALLFARGIVITIRLNGNEAKPQEVFLVLAENILSYSMLSNLIKNAVEASPPHWEVSITLTGCGSVRWVTIHNQGAVPEAIRTTFFDKYVTSGKRNGTGLGTYSARLIAKTQGGDIHMRTSDNLGTEVIVSFPGPHDNSEAPEVHHLQVAELAARERLPESGPTQNSPASTSGIWSPALFIANVPGHLLQWQQALHDQSVAKALVELGWLYQAACAMSARSMVTQVIRLKGLVESEEWEDARKADEILRQTIQKMVQELQLQTTPVDCTRASKGT